MANYSVAEAKNTLPRLIDKAMAGEQVVITRHGKPVAEIRPAGLPAPRDRKALYAWLKARREARPSVGVSSVELLNQMYDEKGY